LAARKAETGRASPATETTTSIDFTPTVETRAEGVFVRLGDEPRTVNRLTGRPLPSNLTHRYRRPWMKHVGGHERPERAEPGDAAELIPPLRQDE
jgi:hypothetical protein